MRAHSSLNHRHAGGQCGLGSAARRLCSGRAAAGRLATAAGKSAGPRGRGGPGLLQEIDLKRAYKDPTYQPDRYIGPVEVQLPSGKPRRVVAKRDMPTGSLLFVSEPIAIVRGDPGRTLLPDDLLAHMQSKVLSDADKYKLAVLYDGTAASQQRQTSFKDFDQSTAATKATKAKAAAKGFGGGGGAAAAAAPAQQAAGQQRVSVELSADKLESIVTYNAWGSEVADIGAAPARGEPLDSFVGMWPEFSLLNHSCIPNATATLLGDRLVVRAASLIPKGAQVTISYLDTKGGVPLTDRRRALQAAYGFSCRCVRCQLEEGAPEELRAQLSALHAASLPGSGGPFEDLPRAAAEADAAALRSIAAAATSQIKDLDAQLDAAGTKAGSLDRAALSASAAGFLLQAARARLAASEAGGGGNGGSGSSGGSEDDLKPTDLLDLVEVLRVYQPGGPGLLATAADALSYTAARHGPGSPQARAALDLFLKMILVRYGEVADRSVLEGLVEAVTRSAPRLAALGLDGGFALGAPAAAAADAEAVGAGA